MNTRWFFLYETENLRLSLKNCSYEPCLFIKLYTIRIIWTVSVVVDLMEERKEKSFFVVLQRYSANSTLLHHVFITSRSAFGDVIVDDIYVAHKYISFATGFEAAFNIIFPCEHVSNFPYFHRIFRCFREANHFSFWAYESWKFETYPP